MRRILILGSTGSIGTQALDVIRANPDRFEVAGLAAGTDRDGVARQAAEFGVDTLTVNARNVGRARAAGDRHHP